MDVNTQVALNNAKQSQVVLANAAELAVAVILNVVGNDVSDSINGKPVGMGILNSIIQARFQIRAGLALSDN